MRGRHVAPTRARTKFGVMGLALGTLLAMSIPAIAGPAPKVDVCHYDADSGTYHVINISENAFEAHVNHGDYSPGDLAPGASSMIGDTTASTPWGTVDLDFDIFENKFFDDDCSFTGLEGWVSWERDNTWAGPVVAANFAAGTFAVRVTQSSAPDLTGCDIGFTVTEGGSGVGTWEVSSVVHSPSDSCIAVGQVQGPWTITSGSIVINP